MVKEIRIWLLIGLCGLAGSGCTSRAWYEGFQEQQRRECYRLSNQSDIQECLERVDDLTYDQYLLEQKERASSMEPG